jgi:DNA-binding response OmpR family regulator
MSSDRENRILFSRIARRWHEVRLLVAERAHVGLHMTALHCPELVVVDNMLADANRLSVVRALRKSKHASRRSVVVLGVDRCGEEQGLLNAGCDAYLTKPLNISTVDRIALGLLELASTR